MRPLITIASLASSAGGPSVAVSRLTESLGAALGAVDFLTTDYLDLSAIELKGAGVRRYLIEGKYFRPLKFRYPAIGGREFLELMQKVAPDIIHDHGIWLRFNHLVASSARVLSIPRVLSTHGTLDTWSIKHKGWKKRVALQLYQRRDLESANCLQVNSIEEAINLRNFGLKQPIALIPNGIDLPKCLALPGENEIKNFLFLGRLHPIKNIDLIIRAFSLLTRQDWKLHIAGPDEGGYRSKLEALVHDLDLSNNIHFHGAVSGEQKEGLFLETDTLLLVSKTENFGIAAAEALSYGIPVIASKHTPWQCLIEHKMGWHLEAKEKVLSDCLEGILEEDASRLQLMGQRARAYAEDHFAWPKLTHQYTKLYRWVLGQGDRPDCILDI